MSAKSSRASKQQRMRRGVALLAGCAVLLSGIGVLTGIWIERAKLQRDQARIEILSRVSAQLGNQESLASRAAGLAGLEMLARSNQSDAEFLNLICDILQGFIDERAPKHEDSDLLWNLVKIEISHTNHFSLEPGAIIKKLGLRGSEAARLIEWDASWRTHKREVEQAIITFSSILALNKRISNHPNLAYRYLPDLKVLSPNRQINLRQAVFSGSFLPKAYLARANLTGAVLSGANLSRARLHKVDLAKAFLYGTNLTEAELGEANLTEAILSEADLTKAGFTNSDLTEANLWEANLTEVRVYKTDLTEADLERANLTGAIFDKANLTKATLRRANLMNARLKKTNLRRANLARANLTQARLDEINLTEANLGEANLTQTLFCKAILQGALIYNVQFTGAVYNEKASVSCQRWRYLPKDALEENLVTQKWLRQQVKRN